VISVAVLLLAISNLRGNAQYYMTINELIIAPEKWNQNVRISGAVRGDSIQVNPQTGYLTFVAVNVPGDMKTVEQMGGIAAVLHQAVIDPNAASLTIRYHGARPDLLKMKRRRSSPEKCSPMAPFWQMIYCSNARQSTRQHLERRSSRMNLPSSLQVKKQNCGS